MKLGMALEVVGEVACMVLDRPVVEVVEAWLGMVQHMVEEVVVVVEVVEGHMVGHMVVEAADREQGIE